MYGAATERVHAVELLARFHALDRDAEVERARDRNDAGDERAVFGAGGEVVHERAVDFQFVDRQPAQVTEARIAGAEVVDHEQRPGAAPQPLERGERGLVALHQLPFGDLELERATRELRAC